MTQGETLHSLLERIPESSIAALKADYPHLELGGRPSLAEKPVVMLVALTGTGKSTTLDHLSALREAGELSYRTDIPTRRELADRIVIPAAQCLLGEPVMPVSDRAERFRLTAAFAAHITGGFAAAYAWLGDTSDSSTPYLSDGIRGHGEIAHVLAHYPQWRIVELHIDTVTRLERLSHREDKFDNISGAPDVDFLPVDLHPHIIEGLQNGRITPAALRIVQAEASNYGTDPYPEEAANYQCIRTDGLSPKQVTQTVRRLLEG